MKKLVNYANFNYINENQKEIKNDVGDENWEETKKEILKYFKKLSPNKKRAFIRKLEKDVKKDKNTKNIVFTS